MCIGLVIHPKTRTRTRGYLSFRVAKALRLYRDPVAQADCLTHRSAHGRARLRWRDAAPAPRVPERAGWRPPQHFGAPGVRAEDNLHRGRGGGGRSLPHRGADRLQQHLSGVGELAADHDQARVQQVHCGRDRRSDGRPRHQPPRGDAPRSPSRTSSSARATETGSPRLRASRSATARGLTSVSTQPRLPQRQISPPSTAVMCPSLAGDAAGAAVRACHPGSDRRRRRPTGGRKPCRRLHARRRTGARPSLRHSRRSRSAPGSPSRASSSQVGCRGASSRGGCPSGSDRDARPR